MNASGALRLMIVITALATTSLVLWAQDTEPPDEPEGITEDEDRARIESADHLRYDATEGMYYLDGNVILSHKDIKLYCDSATYDYDNNRAVAQGNPRVVNPDTTVTGDIIEANFDDEVATISGNVTAVTQRKKKTDEQAAEEGDGDDDDVPRDVDEVWEKVTTITCPKVVYRYADDVKTTHATGRIKAVQEDKTLYADEALYEELEDTVTLTGDVRVVTERGDEFRCPKAVISVEEDWLQAESVTGVAVRRDDEDEEE
jgi:lipopolysaccharide assembly outer membrane protein LptD (OstA)